MKLKNVNESPVGGWWFSIYDSFNVGKELPVVTSDDSGLDMLVKRTAARMRENGLSVPENLRAVIEDQICQRQPENRCRYSAGLGDVISFVIHKGAGAIDKITGGNLKQKARSCRKCGQRRVAVNQN